MCLFYSNKSAYDGDRTTDVDFLWNVPYTAAWQFCHLPPQKKAIFCSHVSMIFGSVYWPHECLEIFFCFSFERRVPDSVLLFEEVFLNGPTPVSLCLFSSFSNTNFTEKTVGFSGIRTRIVGVEGKHADHLTTTMAQNYQKKLPKWIVAV